MQHPRAHKQEGGGGRPKTFCSVIASMWLVVLLSALMGCAVSSVEGVPINATQVRVLETLQDAWKRTYTGWNNNSDCADAYGLGCNGNGEVTFMSLSYEGLVGTIPPALGNLTSLTQLYLYNNQLNGTIPDSFSGLTNLWSLFLGSNLLTGTIPASLSTLRNLRGLWLNNNKLTGRIPVGFSVLSNLRSLWLHGTEISGDLPISLGITQGLVNLTLPSAATCPSATAPCPGLPPPESRSAFCNVTCPAFCKSCNRGFTYGFEPVQQALPEFLNKRVFRHASTQFKYDESTWYVRVDTDWTTEDNRLQRAVVPPVKNQGPCGACWAVAPVAAVSAAAAMVFNLSAEEVPDLSVQQVISCSSSTNGCEGDLPSVAFDYMVKWTRSGTEVTRKYKGLYTEAKYVYGASATACQVPEDQPTEFGTLMYEQADFYGWFGLLLALREQPVVVMLHAGCDKFISYPYGGEVILRDEGNTCSFVPNHAVLAVGYTLNDPSMQPHWLLQNSWGKKWGIEGRIKVAMTHGFGVCNMHLAPPLYPVIATSDPCKSNINVCGSGECVSNGNGSNTCKCKEPFINVVNNDNLTESCVPKDICRFLIFNPCSVGKCISDGQGDYSCLCPLGYSNGQRSTDGASTCVSGLLLSQQNYTVTTANLTCQMLAEAFGLSVDQLMAQNKWQQLICNDNGIPVGTVASVKLPLDLTACEVFYTWNKGDSCSTVATRFNLTGASSDLERMNPWVRCSTSPPQVGTTVCVQRFGTAMSTQDCTVYYPAQQDDTCDKIMRTSKLTAMEFFRLNPGIFCDKLGKSTKDTAGQQVCIAASSISVRQCQQGSTRYTVRLGDSCLNLGGKFESWKQMVTLNGGWSCVDAGLYVGKVICIPLIVRRPPPIKKSSGGSTPKSPSRSTPKSPSRSQ